MHLVSYRSVVDGVTAPSSSQSQVTPAAVCATETSVSHTAALRNHSHEFDLRVKSPLSVCLSVCPSVCPSVCLSVCVSV